MESKKKKRKRPLAAAGPGPVGSPEGSIDFDKLSFGSQTISSTTDPVLRYYRITVWATHVSLFRDEIPETTRPC